MKNEIRLALLCLAVTAVPTFAQNALPQCGFANFDQTLNAFTIKNPTADAVNQQCLLTVYPTGAAPSQSREYPALYPVEGTYVIELSGGGGGGGGAGTSKDRAGGGGGGAGAAPSRTVQYLSSGVYKLTIGTGGEGGSAGGGRTEDGNPTSLTKADTGQLIAGFAGADVWVQRTRAAGSGRGGVAAAGGSSGGSGGNSGEGRGSRSEQAAQAGGALQTPGYSGMPGQAGVESGRKAAAGGGGGAGVESGGTGESARRNMVAGPGDRGGHGFIRLTMSEPAPQAIAPAPAPEVIVIVTKPEVIVQAPVIRRYSLSTDTLFGFNKSRLSAEGEAKLDDIGSKLREVNIESITDTGHADRIGSEEYNQKLSVSRAETVKAYLASKGVQSDRISAVGKGKSQPVTSPDACKGPATPKVIACLQPDRRVEIEVRGSEKVKGMN
jgi:outer membrane protein OmpA-like peptidoglycan-associated protein